jgi:hypothetical protein
MRSSSSLTIWQPSDTATATAVLKSQLLPFSRFASSEVSVPAAIVQCYLLVEQILGRVIHVVISKACHSEIAMVIVWLESYVDARFNSSFFGCVEEIFRQELPLLVKVVTGPLGTIRDCNERRSIRRTTSISRSNGPPFHSLINSVESCSAPFVCQSLSPKYPLNAFSPQGAFNGFAIGAKALQLLYMPGFFRNRERAP